MYKIDSDIVFVCRTYTEIQLQTSILVLLLEQVRTLSWAKAYLIIVTDAADAVSVNFFGLCKFLQILLEKMAIYCVFCRNNAKKMAIYCVFCRNLRVFSV